MLIQFHYLDSVWLEKFPFIAYVFSFLNFCNAFFKCPEIIENYTSGPSEFIGYINNAKYVFTNSFHATAFSIILEKQFAVFLLENTGLRLKNILENFDLLDRIDYDNLHKEINWKQVDEKYKLLSKESKNFLLKNIW